MIQHNDTKNNATQHNVTKHTDIYMHNIALNSITIKKTLGIFNYVEGSYSEQCIY
jgi:hypothetical protein